MAQAFNLRGTNGTGKTFVAREILKRSGAQVHQRTERGKPLCYMGELFGKPIVIFGSYETACGGCDTIPSVHIVAQMLQDFMPEPDLLVFYEGLMISHMIGTVGAVAKEFNDDHYMGFLDTPLETCISRVVARRVAAGNSKKFDPNTTLIKDYRAVSLAKANAEKQGFNVLTIRHNRAVKDVLYYLQYLADN